jgi:hypothetical protein
VANHQAAWLQAVRLGDYAIAWRINDATLASRDPSERDNLNLPYHLRWVWDGRPFRNRHVLIRCYHGLGDTLQFARYLPRLRAMVASLAVEVQPELLPLLRTIPGPDRLLPFVLDNPAPESECDIEIMELCHALRLRPEDAPSPLPRVTPSSLPRGAIGLCWQAGGWDPGRSIDPALFATFVSRPCVTLQPCPTNLKVLNTSGCPRDIEGTAALIAGLDLVITADTMVAHLAGSLRRPVWLLLKHDADWRWMSNRVDSPWYPSMRLYRQPTQGDWTSVVASVAADLDAWRPASART